MRDKTVEQVICELQWRVEALEKRGSEGSGATFVEQDIYRTLAEHRDSICRLQTKMKDVGESALKYQAEPVANAGPTYSEFSPLTGVPNRRPAEYRQWEESRAAPARPDHPICYRCGLEIAPADRADWVLATDSWRHEECPRVAEPGANTTTMEPPGRLQSTEYVKQTPPAIYPPPWRAHAQMIAELEKNIAEEQAKNTELLTRIAALEDQKLALTVEWFNRGIQAERTATAK